MRCAQLSLYGTRALCKQCRFIFFQRGAVGNGGRASQSADGCCSEPELEGKYVKGRTPAPTAEIKATFFLPDKLEMTHFYMKDVLGDDK